MPRFPESPSMLSGLITISTAHVCSCGGIDGFSFDVATSKVWAAANRAEFYPFRLGEPFNARLMWVFNGAAVNGNFYVGIYDEYGVRLVTSAAVAQAGVEQIQTIDIIDTFLLPGLYYMALARDNNVGTARACDGGIAGNLAMFGCAYMNAAYPLPANAVLVAGISRWLTIMGITDRGFV